MTKKLFALYLVILHFLIFGQIVFGQSSAILGIRVTDSNGDRVNNIVLKVKKQNKLIKEIESKEFLEFNVFNLEIGTYLIEIEAEGFDALSQEVEVKRGKNNVTLVLNVNSITESVEVRRDPQEKSIDDVFSGFYTKEQIADLPNKSADIVQELKRRYGPDVVISVDGFTNRVPDKSHIASIRVAQSSYDAENHEIGFTYVRITTKVSKQSFHGSIGFDFDDESLNARNPLAPSRLPEQSKDIDFSLLGPLINERASFFFSALNNSKIERKNIIAILPEGSVRNALDSTTRFTVVRGDVIANLAKQHTARFAYRSDDIDRKNIGVGGFNLPERAYSIGDRKHIFRVSESGYIGNKFFNEFRFELIDASTQIVPDNNTVTVNVLDAFNSGGAGNSEKKDLLNLSISDNFLFGFQKHAIKIGGLFQFERANFTSEFNQNGTFIFSSLEDFVAERPSLYFQRVGSRQAEISQTELGLFVQDDFRILKNLGLSFGLRYELQNNLSDINNFSPRIGFVWSPFKDGKITLRGGSGIFFNWLETNTLSFVRTRSIDQPNEIVITNPEFPNPLFSGSITPQSQTNFWQFADNLRNPYIFHTSFAFNWQIVKSHKLRAEYVYQKGVHQFRTRNLNAPLVGIRPNPELGNVNQLESSGFFVRNSLSLNLNGYLPKRISYGVNYTLSKILSDSGGIFVLPTNNYDLSLDRAVSNTDQRHRLSASMNWEIKKSFSVAAIYNFSSALPYTISTGFDDNGDTVFNDRPFGIRRNSERGTSRSHLDVGASWFFSFVDFKGKKKGLQSATFKPGEIARPHGLTDENKRFSLKLYISARNVLNQTNLGNFVGVQTSPLFRQATLAEQARRIEMGLRFNF